MAEIKFNRWGIRVYATLNIRRVIPVTGVNNRIDEQTYFLMWDFDNANEAEVIEALREVQSTFQLPPVIILSTGKPGGYHAYCFKACDMLWCRRILNWVRGADTYFLAAGLTRGYWTLRYTDMPDREFKYVCTLPSKVKPDLDYSDVTSFVKYTKTTKEVI